MTCRLSDFGSWRELDHLPVAIVVVHIQCAQYTLNDKGVCHRVTWTMSRIIYCASVVVNCSVQVYSRIDMNVLCLQLSLEIYIIKLWTFVVGTYIVIYTYMATSVPIDITVLCSHVYILMILNYTFIFWQTTYIHLKTFSDIKLANR